MRVFLILILSAISFSLCSQSYCDSRFNVNWLWSGVDTISNKGATFILTFDEDSLTYATMDRTMYLGTQNCTMSDSVGNLLYYSNGCYINDEDHEFIPGSDSLNPGFIDDEYCIEDESGYIGIQSMITLPHPTNDSVFTIFHERLNLLYDPVEIVTDRLYVTEVNPNKNNLDRVLVKSKPILADSSIQSGYLTAVRHANGQDWWVLTRYADTNGFIRILVTPDSIDVHDIQFLGNNLYGNDTGGQMKVSPEGKEIIIYHPRIGGFLYDFSRDSGLLSNFRTFGRVDSTSIAGGCEFSPSGKYIYTNTMVDVYQYDITAFDINGSEVHLGHYDGYLSPFATRFFSMERGPNGKIYINSPNGVNVLHVINNPNEKGVDCMFIQHDLILPIKIYFSMPHFPNYHLGALDDELCPDSSVSVSGPGVNQMEIRIYPNPTDEHLTVDMGSYDMACHLNLYNLDGVKIDSYYFLEEIYHLDISNLRSGLYIIELTSLNGEQLYIGKISKL